MSGGQNTKPSPSNASGSIGIIDKDASLVSTEKAHRATVGYTIIEVMIFLAISGVMFLIAAVFINGKQAQVDFRQNVNVVDSDVRSTINDVENGFYPSGNNIVCTSSSSAGISNTGDNSQGSNRPCVFLGKAMNFGTDDYNIVSIAGNATDSNGNIPTDIDDGVQPTAIENGTTQTKSVGGGLIQQVCNYTTAGNGQVSFGFAILTSLNPAASSSTSGAPTTAALFRYDGIMSQDQATGVGNTDDDSIAGIHDSDAISKVVIYMSDGSRAATITIGNNNGLSTAITYVPVGVPSCG